MGTQETIKFVITISRGIFTEKLYIKHGKLHCQEINKNGNLIPAIDQYFYTGDIDLYWYCHSKRITQNGELDNDNDNYTEIYSLSDSESLFSE